MKILVVDDEERFARLLADDLKDSGHDVTVLTSGAAALTDSGAGYDVVITDLKMAPVDGIGLLEAVKAASPDTEVVVMTAFGAVETAVDIGLAAQCAEAVGLMDRLVAMTVEYMNTRKQFGVAIASFQALRHRMADVKMQLELGRSMSYYASLKLGEAVPQRRRAISQARVQLGHSMRFVGQQCIQLHGGIGVTDECSASHYFKRLTMLEMSYGDTLHHLGEVSSRMQDTAGVFA